jgi:hypothetical protein
VLAVVGERRPYRCPNQARVFMRLTAQQHESKRLSRDLSDVS